MQAEQKVTFTDEREAVARTIQAYVDGGKSGKGDDMKPAFHEGATIYGYVGQDLFGGQFSYCLIGMTAMARPRSSGRRSRTSTLRAP
jgi:hypothetical protein